MNFQTIPRVFLQACQLRGNLGDASAGGLHEILFHLRPHGFAQGAAQENFQGAIRGFAESIAAAAARRYLVAE